MPINAELRDFVQSLANSSALLRRIRVVAQRASPFRCVAHFSWKPGKLRTTTLSVMLTTAVQSTVWAVISSIDELAMLHFDEIAFVACIRGLSDRCVGTLPDCKGRWAGKPLEDYRVFFAASPPFLCYGCLSGLDKHSDTVICRGCGVAAYCSKQCSKSDPQHRRFCVVIRYLALGSSVDSD